MTNKEKIQINATIRQAGKGQCRKLRREKLIPAVIYGPKTEPLNIAIEERDAIKYGKHGLENTIFNLMSEDKAVNGQQVLKKVMTVHPVSRKPVHIDFYALDMTQLVQVNVELNFVGTSQGEKDGGVFNAVRRDLEIECLPTDIPEKFDVDISGMEMNDTLHVSDLKLGDVKILTPEELTICSVAEVKEEKVDPEEAAAAAAAALAEPGAEGEAPAAGGEKKDGEKKEGEKKE